MIALCMGAWIEIPLKTVIDVWAVIALCMGAWIEILSQSPLRRLTSHRTLYGCVD